MLYLLVVFLAVVVVDIDSVFVTVLDIVASVVHPVVTASLASAVDKQFS